MDNTKIQPKNENCKNSFAQVKNYLLENYHFRYNNIKNCFYFRDKKGDTFEVLDEEYLYVYLRENGYKIGIEDLIRIVKTISTHYNPFIDYFTNLDKWQETDIDYIKNLCSHIIVEPKDRAEFDNQFKKFLVRAVKCAVIENYFNKQAFILVHEKQNSGKTTFCRFLCPPTLKEYIAENINKDKDTRISLANNFLINLDELAALSKQEINYLKSLFTISQINERLPYDKKTSIIKRCCSFIGSTNDIEFLTDHTGNVRWLCFRINRIDFSYTKNIDINRVWAQAFALACSENFNCEITAKEIELLEERNREFEIKLEEEELIMKYFRKTEENNSNEFYTASEVRNILFNITQKANLCNARMIGKILVKLGYKRVLKRRGEYPVYGYYLASNQDNITTITTLL